MNFFAPDGTAINIDGLVFAGIEGIDCGLPIGEFQTRTFDGSGVELNNVQYRNTYFAGIGSSNIRLDEFPNELMTIKITALDGGESISAYGATTSDSPQNVVVMAFTSGNGSWTELDHPNGKSLPLHIVAGVSYVSISVKPTSEEPTVVNILIS